MTLTNAEMSQLRRFGRNFESAVTRVTCLELKLSKKVCRGLIHGAVSICSIGLTAEEWGKVIDGFSAILPCMVLIHEEFSGLDVRT